MEINMGQAQVNHSLDVSGHKCPIPVLRLRRIMQKMSSGQQVEVKATDPMTLIDIPNFCREAGHKLISVIEKEDYILYLVEHC